MLFLILMVLPLLEEVLMVFLLVDVDGEETVLVLTDWPAEFFTVALLLLTLTVLIEALSPTTTLAAALTASVVLSLGVMASAASSSVYSMHVANGKVQFVQNGAAVGSFNLKSADFSPTTTLAAALTASVVTLPLTLTLFGALTVILVAVPFIVTEIALSRLLSIIWGKAY